MKNDHIIELLEEKPLSDLSPEDLATLNAHIAECSECRRAYEAACISTAMLKAHASEGVEPTPVFPARVMAALREQQQKSVSAAFLITWRLAAGLISSILVLVSILSVLTFLNIPFLQSKEEPGKEPDQTVYAVENVILEGGNLLMHNDMSYSTVLETVFNPEDTYYGNY